MKTIEITNETFQRLQTIAEPLIDTPATVISKLLDAYSNDGTQAIKIGFDIGLLPQVFLAISPPDLKHTKLLYAEVGSQPIIRPNWNEIVRIVHQLAFKQLKDFETIQTITSARVFNGEKRTEGYTPLEGCGFSIQGMDANESWKSAFDLARQIQCPLDVRFIWRDKPAAAFPGAQGIMRWHDNIRALRETTSAS